MLFIWKNDVHCNPIIFYCNLNDFFMKKLLLLSFTLFTCVFLFGQATTLNQPAQYNRICDDNNDGYATFAMQEISAEILGQVTINNLVTHHLNQSDASTGSNSLPNSYTNITSGSQLVFARVLNLTTNQVDIISYNLIVNSIPLVTSYTFSVCELDGFLDGLTTSSSLSSHNTNFSNNNQNTVSYFHTQANAQANVNPIITTTSYNNINPYQEIVFVRVQSITGCFSISQLIILVQSCGATTCTNPSGITVSNITVTSVEFNWATSTATNGYQHEVYIVSHGSSAPTATSQGIIATGFPVVSNLQCGNTYDYYVRTICGNIGNSVWAGPYSFSTLSCGSTIGQPTNLTQCQSNGQACFNLTSNTPIILANLNSGIYSVTYFTSQVDATNSANAIANPSQYCITTASQVIYARVSNASDATFQTVSFSIMAIDYTSTVADLTDMTQCDDDNDTVVTFNLTAVQSQLNTNYALEYYTSLVNAQYQTVPITNPAVFNVGTQSPSTTIFVREINPTSCDNIYKFNTIAYAVCNNAYVCNAANSLCSALGVPFANTHQGILAEAGNSYGCLNTRPNPTWFYLPVSSAGTINLMIQQNTAINFISGLALDVDYICYGPFSNPVTPCSGQLTADKIVRCSYSASATEYPVIPNALPGQYYLIMTTNFSNRAGYIKISEMSTTQGGINCSGLRLNAFLDTNANGAQEVGEQNFPLGQFHYEVNQNGNAHNIIAPTGIYNIYDINPANSYNISYTIDSNYTTNYSVAPASYSNVNVVVGAGMLVYNFPVTVTNNYADLAIINVPIQQPRPGFTYTNKIIYTNLGTQPVASGTVTFNKDALVTITANTQAGTVATPTGFTYDFTNLLPFEVRTMTVTMQVPTIPTITLGDLLTNSATITPLTGDVVPANNSASVTQIIIGSYDPNDKMESHGEQILFSSFTANDYLTYTIRFENTGTASAINVRVNDVLDSRLDENSIKMESASHNYVMDRMDNNLTWKFDNIELPATAANAIASKGYIQFKIKPKPGYAVGDIIPNTASIYFDYNPAIITNTFHTQFMAQLAVDQFENGNFVFYPNPTTDFVTISLKNTENSISSIVLYDMIGKLILEKKPNTSITTETVNLSSVNPGIYFIEVTTDTELKVVKKLIVK